MAQAIEINAFINQHRTDVPSSSPSSGSGSRGQIQQNHNSSEDDGNEDNDEQGGVDVNEEGNEKALVISPYYRVFRYHRQLRRSEVIGFCFVSLIVACIALQALIGLEAMGFSVPTIIKTPWSERMAHSPPWAHPYPPQTFSWKALSDFFLPDSIPQSDRDCLTLHKTNRAMLQRQDLEKPNGTTEKEDLFMEDWIANMNQLLNSREDGPAVPLQQNLSLPHRYSCGVPRITDEWSWFCKYLLQIFLPLLNLYCTTLILTCIRLRRRKGFQFTLMLPSFLAVFLGIFQQIPMLFTYSYTGMYVLDEMNKAAFASVPPVLIAPMWNETQYHEQCCGVHSPETWTIAGRDVYPISCCNNLDFPCNGKFARREEVWNRGCYNQESEKIRYYELLSMLILLLKLFAEMGILWCLTDLSRYEYPRPEELNNATCECRDFEVRSKGCAKILGVTERKEMVIKLNKFQPQKYMFRITQSGNCKVITVRTIDGCAGSIEIQRVRQNRNSDNANVNLSRARRQGLIFITF